MTIPLRRALTAAQVRAIRAVMCLLVEDDLARGVSKPECWCARCAAPRPAPGAVTYDGVTLCNACATRFELARAAGRVRSVDAFLRGRGGQADAAGPYGQHRAHCHRLDSSP